MHRIHTPDGDDYNNRLTVARTLAHYPEKVVHCSTIAEIRAFEKTLIPD